MSEINRIFGRGEQVGADGAETDHDPERRAEAEQLLRAYLDETLRFRDRNAAYGLTVRGIFGADPKAYASGVAVLDAEPALQVAFIRAAVDWSLRRITEDRRWHLLEDVWRVGDLMSLMYRRWQPYSAQDVCWILERLAGSGISWEMCQAGRFGLGGLLRSIQRGLGERQLEPAARAALARIHANVSDAERYADGRETLALIDRMLGVERRAELIDQQDDWGQLAGAAFVAMAPEERAAWLDVLAFAAAGSGSKPSKKWLEQARTQVERCGVTGFRVTTVAWLRLLDEPSRNALHRRPDGFPYPTAVVADRNADILKGLAWCCAVLDDEAVARALGGAALARFKKLPNIGARSTKAGNACVYALGAMPNLAAVAQLQRLSQRVKRSSALKQIESALEAVAKLHGLTRDDLDDLAVPTFGLVDGVLRTQIGTYGAEIVMTGSESAELRFERADGRVQSSVPAELKRDYPAEVKALQQTVKDVRAALQAQRGRVEWLLLAEREWSLTDWRARYLDHPLLAQLARRLIWTFQDGMRVAQGAWLDGAIVDADDRLLEPFGAATHVRLWHPIGSGAQAVLAWREWLERHGVTQPIKQAHREVYLLTDAERETAVYSNRFAAHILRQHQLQALCQQRGWQYRLQGAWDGANVPTLDLPRWGLQAEYWVEAGDDDSAPMSGHAIYLYVATDQVRFTRARSYEPIQLTEIPPLVFSEVMRDVDLFVGVSSVGTDPAWLDGAAEAVRQHDGYWWDFSFGELSASARTRRDVLERLLPRLTKLAGRWALAGKFLVVRGELRSYKIHLGSGNVLMEPNDQYLCIVPGRTTEASGPRDVYLPFAGDGVLAIILSKAFLLANDQAISDPTITRQISATLHAG